MVWIAQSVEQRTENPRVTNVTNTYFIDKTRLSLVQKTLFKWGENDLLNRFKIRLIGGRFKKLSLILSLHPLPDLKSFNLNRFTPFKII